MSWPKELEVNRIQFNVAYIIVPCAKKNILLLYLRCVEMKILCQCGFVYHLPSLALCCCLVLKYALVCSLCSNWTNKRCGDPSSHSERCLLVSCLAFTQTQPAHPCISSFVLACIMCWLFHLLSYRFDLCCWIIK